MFWCVCKDHGKHSRVSTLLSTRGMAAKPLRRWSRPDHVLLLLLLCCPGVTVRAQSPAAVTGGIAANVTSAYSFTTDSSHSSTETATASPVARPNTTTRMETTATSSHMNTTNPAMTFTTLLHSTNNWTTENPTLSETTSSSTTENTTLFQTTISASTENTTLPETTISTSTENTTLFQTTISTSTENTTLFQTTISTSTENTTLYETTISPATENTTINTTLYETTISPATENTTINTTLYETTISPATENTTLNTTLYETTISPATENTTLNTTLYETTISASTENTTLFQTTISTSTENTTLYETTISPATENTTLNTTLYETTISPATENTTINTTLYETTISPATENTTLNTTLYETTISASTENTTMNSTTITVTPELLSSTDTATVNQTLTTTGPKPCNFYQSCLNAFYWMTTSVDIKPISQNDQNISSRLEVLFKRKLDACALQSSTPAVADSPLSSNASISPATPNPSLFMAMEFTCDPTLMTSTQCNILLKLSAAADVCCIRDAVMLMNSAQINISVLGQIERVGVCADDMIQISAGQYDKCNQTFDIDVCKAEPQNISCGNSTNVIFPLNNQQNCTASPPKPTCYCSSYCNSSGNTSLSDFYYSFNISVDGHMDNRDTQISILLKSSSCNTSSVCNILQAFTSRVQDSRVTCANQTEPLVCEVIVKLDKAMELCDIRTAVNTIIQQKRDMNFDGVVNRVALCYDPSLHPLQSTLTWRPSLSSNLSSDVFCMESNFNGYCSGGTTVVPLYGTCNSSTGTFLNFTTTPPSVTSLSNTTTINTTATMLSASVNVTTLPANATTTVSTSPSGTLDADALLSLSASASSLNASQVNKLLSQLEALLAGPNVSLALANTSVNIVNNLLDVPADVITPFSKRATGIVDTVGLKLVVSGQSQSVLSESLALAVKKVDGANFQKTSFSLIGSSNLQIRNAQSSVEVKDFKVQSTPLGSVILPASLTQNLTAEDQQRASRVQFNFYQKSTFFQDKSLGDSKLNSGILGSSVANLSISGLQNEVLITLRNIQPISANCVALCVFWDFALNNGSGGWNPSGCRVLNSSDAETQCACNHLTSFGILLDISKTVIPPRDLEILTYITYIGCGISAIFLSVTLLTYLAFDKLRKDIPSKILIHLCFALLLLNLVFLLDAWLALYPDAVGLCISTAFFLHYFLLASFTWMALEAVHMYLAIVKVFNTYISRFMVKIGCAGWGIPLIVVIIVIAVNKDNYGLVTYGRYADGGTDDFCWIKNDAVFYAGVVAYFCLVFLLNFAMFIVVMIQMCRIKKQNPHNVQNRSGWQEIRSVAGLSVLLGLTWGFAFFAWGPVHLAFMYLFAIFNTLQGLFIFVFHCAMKENVRRQWRTYLCCGRLRLAENSEWSRTATQKINKASRKKASSFRSSNSNNSSSSFLNHDSLASETPMGIGNPMDDRIITGAEEHSSGSDVVLNEINNQYRSQRAY